MAAGISVLRAGEDRATSAHAPAAQTASALTLTFGQKPQARRPLTASLPQGEAAWRGRWDAGSILGTRVGGTQNSLREAGGQEPVGPEAADVALPERTGWVTWDTALHARCLPRPVTSEQRLWVPGIRPTHPGSFFHCTYLFSSCLFVFFFGNSIYLF